MYALFLYTNLRKEESNMEKNTTKPPYASITIGGEDYKLKISASAAVDAETKLKKSGVANSLIGAVEKIESITTQTIILHAAMQKYNANIDYKKATELYEQYLDEGGSVLDFAQKIQEIYEVSGFMTQKQVENAQKIMEQMNQ